MRVRELRLARGWSQAQLAEASGLSVRTVQRVEQGAHPGLDSLQRLAAALDVEVAELHAALPPEPTGFRGALRSALQRFDDFEGRAARPEFWWFTLAVTIAISAAAQVSEAAAGLVAVIVLLPWAAVGARRMRDTGRSPWYLLLVLLPVGGPIALLWLLAEPTVPAVSASSGPERTTTLP